MNLEQARNGEYPTTSPVDDNVECLFRVALVSLPLSILLMLESCVPIVIPKIAEINLEYWRSYEDLKECILPLKTLSSLLESSTELTIHNMLEYFIRLLYDVFMMLPKDILERASYSILCGHI